MRNQKLSIVAFSALVLLMLVAPSPAPAADAADIELPEAETFLLLAAREMRSFHSEYKTYAKDWYRLGFDYAYPNYHTSDPDIYPLPQDKNRWRPRGSHYTYVIVSATDDRFLIQAIDADNKVAYEMRQDMKQPKKVK